MTTSLLLTRLTGLNSGLAMKAPVRVATTGSSLTLSGLQTIDGVTLASSDVNLRVLVKDQTDTRENGIWDAKSTAWTRSADFDASDDFVYGTRIFVQRGTTNANTEWVTICTDPVTVGTSTITFIAVSVDAAVTVGTTAILSGTTTRILYDNAGTLGEYTVSGSGTAVAMATSPTLVTPALGTPTSGTLTNCTGYSVGNLSGLGTNVATFLATPSSANLASAIADETGSGALVFANTPTLVSPVLGTPSSGTLTNCTIPIGGVTGLGTGVATFLATPSSANLASAITDETGSGALVFGTSPTITTSLNINGGSGAAVITSDAANILAQRSGTNAQKMRWYQSFTDASNGAWAEIDLNTANTMIIGSNGNGSGASTISKIQFNALGSNVLDYQVTANATWFFTGSIRASSNFIAGTGGEIQFQASTKFRDQSDGVITIANQAFTDFGRIQFGGTSSSFPAIARSGTTLQVKLADNTSGGTLQVTGTLRVDQTPSAVGTGAKTISNGADSSTNFGHYFSINLNGTTYFIPASSVAPT